MPTLEEQVLEMQNNHPIPMGGFRQATQAEMTGMDSLAAQWQADSHGVELGEFLGLAPYYPAFLDRQLVPSDYAVPNFAGAYWSQHSQARQSVRFRLPCGCVTPVTDQALDVLVQEFSLSPEQFVDRIVQNHTHDGEPGVVIARLRKELGVAGFEMIVEKVSQ
jgi:hypothetical protein